MAFNPLSLRLCLVTDRALARGRPLFDIVAAAVRGGATMVQLREKNATTRAFLDEARALKALLAPLGIPLVINDRLDIALAVDADGIHVGQTDMPVAEVRRIAGPDKFIGLSITNAPQIARPDAAMADYLGIGPLYLQQTKSDASMPLGVEGFRHLRAQSPKPVVAIGGLKPDNSAPVIAAGADGLAIVSAIVGADDPEQATREFAKLFASPSKPPHLWTRQERKAHWLRCCGLDYTNDDKKLRDRIASLFDIETLNKEQTHLIYMAELRLTLTDYPAGAYPNHKEKLVALAGKCFGD